ncbi:unnamed protein product [Sphagnum jensenii]|uniref:SKP1 component POZ domain-containing protein n=1 Tax=Sphagnum jensenii TaxID=128206 RepID=A0ABP1A8K6_9BRYO
MSHRTGECSANEKSVAVYGEYLEMSSQAFYRRRWLIVKNAIEDTGTDHPIPLPKVSSKILAKVIEYCKYHVGNQKSTDDKPATPEDEVKSWDQDFVMGRSGDSV